MKKLFIFLLVLIPSICAAQDDTTEEVFPPIKYDTSKVLIEYSMGNHSRVRVMVGYHLVISYAGFTIPEDSAFDKMPGMFMTKRKKKLKDNFVIWQYKKIY